MSSAELSLDISELVSRAVSGETIDAAAEGRSLAARYPDLGMTEELISKAIARAAGMMGVALPGYEPEPALAPPATTGAVATEAAATEPAPGADRGATDVPPADITGLMSSHGDEAILVAPSPSHDSPLAPAPENTPAGDGDVVLPPGTTAGAMRHFLAGGPVAAVRRAFSRS